jgi:hypothetical protein
LPARFRNRVFLSTALEMAAVERAREGLGGLSNLFDDRGRLGCLGDSADGAERGLGSCGGANARK